MLVHHHMGYRQGQMTLCSRPRGNPLVGVGAGLRHPALDLHELPPIARATLAHRSVADVVCNRRVPRAKEVRAEAQHVVRPCEIEGGKLAVAEAQSVRFTQNGIVERLKRNHRRAVEAGEKPLDQRPALPHERTGQERQGLGGVLGGERTEMGDEILDCLVPADPGELAGATLSRALQGLRDPVGVVRHL